MTCNLIEIYGSKQKLPPHNSLTHQVRTCMYWFPPMRVGKQPLGMNTTYKYWSPPMPIEKQPLGGGENETVRFPQPIGIRHSTCSWRHDTSGTGTAGTGSSYTV